MSNEKKTIATSVNLPVENISTIIDVDSPSVEINIEDAIKKLKGGALRSMNAVITVNNFSEMQNPRNLNLKNIDIDYDLFQITKIERKKIEKTNDIKFFKSTVEFANGLTKTIIAPSYIKLYSSRRGCFIPIEFVRNRDILLDYTGNMVKISDAELVDFKMTDFYNINVVYEIEEVDVDADINNNRKHLNENCNFYFNGILANVSYNNFQKKD